MIVLGVALIIIGAGFAAAAVVGGWGSQTHPVNFAVATVSDWSSAAVFLAGMGAMLVLLLGIWVFQRASRRRARSWRDDRRARRESGAAVTERAADSSAGTVPPPPPPSETPVIDPYAASEPALREEHDQPQTRRG